MSVGLVASRLDNIAGKYPDKPAFIFRRASHWDTLTFKQLLARTESLANGLQKLGLKPGTYAALMLPTGIEFFALTFALAKTGIVPVLVDPAVGWQVVTRCFTESKPGIFFGTPVTHLLRRFFGWGKETITFNITMRDLGRLTSKDIDNSTPISIKPPSLSPASPAAIIYTSGSTGLPKGAVYSQSNFVAQIDTLIDTFDIGSDEIDLPAFPLFALIDCLVGVTAIIPDMNFPSPARINPERVINAIHKFYVSNMFASPIMLDKLAEYGLNRNIKLTSLKRVITAGAPAPVHILENFRKLLSP